MEPTDQIAADFEQWLIKTFGVTWERSGIMHQFKTAIEKAYQLGCDDTAVLLHEESDDDVGIVNHEGTTGIPHAQSRAAQASEQCNHQWVYAFTISSKGKPPINIDQCVRCGVEQKQSAHASEQTDEDFLEGRVPPDLRAAQTSEKGLDEIVKWALKELQDPHSEIERILRRVCIKTLTVAERAAHTSKKGPHV